MTPALISIVPPDCVDIIYPTRELIASANSKGTANRLISSTYHFPPFYGSNSTKCHDLHLHLKTAEHQIILI